MAFDLVIGKSSLVKDNPQILGGLEFDEQNIIITGLHKKHPSTVFRLLSNPFSDITIHQQQLVECKEELYKTITKSDLSKNEKNMVYKLTSIICYALDSNLPLHGVAD